MQAYNVAVVFMLLSLWLYIHSYRRKDKLLLLASCAVLGFSLSMIEVGYLVGLLSPVILMFLGRKQANKITWFFAWFATNLLFFLRYIQFQIQKGGGYQSSLIGNIFPSDQIIHNMLFQLGRTLSYFQIPTASPSHWLYSSVVALVSVIMLVLVVKQPATLRKSHYAIAAVFLLIAIVLAIALYIPISGLLSSIRTQFYAAPIQAMLWSILIAIVACVLPIRTRRFWIAGATGLMVLFAIVSALDISANRPMNTNVNFEKTVKILRQMNEIAPHFRPNTLMAWVIPGGTDTPLGWTYYVSDLSRFAFGVQGVQANFIDSLGVGFQFTAQGLKSNDDIIKYPYNQIVAFEIETNGDVQLLERIPPELLPDGVTASGYDPNSRILADDVSKTTPYLH